MFYRVGDALALGYDAGDRSNRQRKDLGWGRRAPDTVILSNIGAAQLTRGFGLDEARRAMDMIDADALVVHLNPLQEACQPEGDRDWWGVGAALEALILKLGAPVVVKETGAGLSGRTARRLIDMGAAAVDVAGAGGANWALIEGARAVDSADAAHAAAFADWGMPTAQALVDVRRACPEAVVIGSGGTVGSQDWMQTALIAKAAGINPRDLRYVALEGGGEIATALLGGHIQVGSTDISDSMPHIQSGDMRILAVFSDTRLDEPEMKNIPTAKEQGYDIVWPVVRGFYLGPKVSDEDYAWWKGAFDTLLASEEFATLRDQRELFPFAMTGPELDTYVKKQVSDYKVLAKEFGLIQ